MNKELIEILSELILYPTVSCKRYKVTGLLDGKEESILRLLKKSPLLYNVLSIKDKKNPIIIDEAYSSFTRNSMPGINFYSLILGSNNKVQDFESVFSGSKYKLEILKILIEEEYCFDKETILLDYYFDLVFEDTNFLNSFLITCGFVGKLANYVSDKDFMLRMLKVNGELIFLSDESIQSDREAVIQAIDTTPILINVFEFDKTDPIFIELLNKNKRNVIQSLTLPCLYND